MRRQRVDNVDVPPSAEAVYDIAVRRAVGPVASGVALLLLGLAVVESIILSGDARQVLSPLGVTLALLLSGVWLVARRGHLDDSAAHPVMAAVLLAPVALAVTEMCLTRSPFPTTLVLLAVVGAGAALLSLRWVAMTLCLAWCAWAGGVVLVGSRAYWSWAVPLAVATVVALVVNRVLRALVRRVADLEDEARAASVRDPLSGLANRRGLAMVGVQIVAAARRRGDAAHCIFVDVDDLNRVNDLLGHAAGDDVVRAIASALRTVTRSTDVVARWGGAEFCVVGPGPGMSPPELERRVRDTVLADPPVSELTWRPHVSAGGAMLAPWDAGTLDTLIGKADEEMHLRRSLRREGHWPTSRTATAD